MSKWRKTVEFELRCEDQLAGPAKWKWPVVCANPGHYYSHISEQAATRAMLADGWERVDEDEASV